MTRAWGCRNATGRRFSALHTWLERLSPTPSVRPGHLVAIAMTHGPWRALALLDTLPDHLLVRQRESAVRAHLLQMTGDLGATARCFRESATMTSHQAEETYLLGRAAEVEVEVEATETSVDDRPHS